MGLAPPEHPDVILFLAPLEGLGVLATPGRQDVLLVLPLLLLLTLAPLGDLDVRAPPGCTDAVLVLLLLHLLASPDPGCLDAHDHHRVLALLIQTHDRRDAAHLDVDRCRILALGSRRGIPLHMIRHGD